MERSSSNSLSTRAIAGILVSVLCIGLLMIGFIIFVIFEQQLFIYNSNHYSTIFQSSNSPSTNGSIINYDNTTARIALIVVFDLTILSFLVFSMAFSGVNLVKIWSMRISIVIAVTSFFMFVAMLIVYIPYYNTISTTSYNIANDPRVCCVEEIAKHSCSTICPNYNEVTQAFTPCSIGTLDKSELNIYFPFIIVILHVVLLVVVNIIYIVTMLIVTGELKQEADEAKDILKQLTSGFNLVGSHFLEHVMGDSDDEQHDEYNDTYIAKPNTYKGENKKKKQETVYLNKNLNFSNGNSVTSKRTKVQS